MGIVPLQYLPGQNAETLGLTGLEQFDINIPADCQPLQKISVQTNDGKKFDVIVRFDTEVDLTYFQHGGILNYMIRSLIWEDLTGNWLAHADVSIYEVSDQWGTRVKLNRAKINWLSRWVAPRFVVNGKRSFEESGTKYFVPNIKALLEVDYVLFCFWYRKGVLRKVVMHCTLHTQTRVI